MPGLLYINVLPAPAGAACQNGTKQAYDYDNHLLHRDHPHVVKFPESRAEDSLGFTKVAPSGGAVNLSPGRQTTLLIANECLLNVQLHRVGGRFGASSDLQLAVDVP